MRIPNETQFFEALVREARAISPFQAIAERKRIREYRLPVVSSLLKKLPASAIEQAFEVLGAGPLLLREVDRERLLLHPLEFWEQHEAIPVIWEGKPWLAAAEPFDPALQSLAAKLEVVGLGYAVREGLLEVLRAVHIRDGAGAVHQDEQVPVHRAQPQNPVISARALRVLEALGLSIPEGFQGDEIERYLVAAGHYSARALYEELSRATGYPFWPGLDGLILERLPEAAELQILPVRRGQENYYASPRAYIEEEIAQAGLASRPLVLIYPEVWELARRSTLRMLSNSHHPRNVLEALYRQGRIEREFYEQHQADVQRGEHLLRARGLVSEEHLAEAQAEVLGLPYIDLSSHPPDPTAKKYISDAYAISLRVIPHHLNEAGELVVVVGDPEDIQRNDELKMLLRNVPLRLAVAAPSLIQRIIARDYGQQRDLEEINAILSETELGETTDALDAESGALDRLVSSFIREALLADASDIHIESHKTQGIVRLRRDGVLYEYMSLPLRSTPAVIQKIKVRANLDIAERRRPQDGRFRYKEGGLEANLRVSTVPGMYGEKLVVRLLKSDGKIPVLEEAGFEPDTLDKLRKIIARPYGLFLITGPTGSGKTRTGISILGELARPEVNVLTVEDPVEYELPGITQVQVNPQAGVSFADVLRAFLRQDPDIIYVGEIRDRETAQVAVQAAFTGHLVIATLHTNDAPSSATRLMDLGVDPANVSAALLGVLAQRLVRRVCAHCSLPDEEGSSGVLLGQSLEQARLANPQGCKRCHHGYAGRTGIFELMEVDHSLQTLISQGVTTTELRRVVQEQGMRTLMQDGIIKVKRGITTAEEILAKTMA